MAQGQHRFGIVQYTHYPNGPVYVLAMMVAMGLSPFQMRVFPVLVSAVALGYMSWSLCRFAGTRVHRLWVLIAAAILAALPGLVRWQGALHEHSYALSIVFVIVALAAAASASRSWLFCVLGFVAGWTGYDWIPTQAAAVFVVRWLYYGNRAVDGVELALGRAAHLALLDAVRFAAGVALAILAHIGQLGLYYEDLTRGARDLLGSATVRMGVDVANAVNPEYAEWLDEEKGSAGWLARRFGQDFSLDSPARFAMIRHFFALHMVPPAHEWATFLACLGGGAMIALDERGRAHLGVLAVGAIPRQLVMAAIALAGTFAACTLWVVLMPHHAVFHAHFLPRHFLAGLVLLFAMPALLTTPAKGTGCTDDVSASALRRAYVAYSAPLILLVLVGLYMLVSASVAARSLHGLGAGMF